MEAAGWIAELLEDRIILDPGNSSSSVKLKVYWDQITPVTPAAHEAHAAALHSARAMVVICTPGACARLDGKDWVAEEIRWWLTNRSTPPICLNLHEGDRWIPGEIKTRWPDVQRVNVDMETIDRLSAEERKTVERNVLSRSIPFIAGSAAVISTEELDRAHRNVVLVRRNEDLARRSVKIISAICLLLACAVAALGLSLCQANILASDAEAAEKIAKDRAADLEKEMQRTTRADSQALVESARGTMRRPEVGVAFLAAAVRRDPTNAPAVGFLISTMIDTRWFIPSGRGIFLDEDIRTLELNAAGDYALAHPIGRGDPAWTLLKEQKNGDLEKVGQISPGEAGLTFSADGRYVLAVEYIADDDDGTIPTGMFWSVDDASRKATGQTPRLPKVKNAFTARVDDKDPHVVHISENGTDDGFPLLHSTEWDEAEVSPDGSFIAAEDSGNDSGSSPGFFLFRRMAVEGRPAEQIFFQKNFKGSWSREFDRGSSFLAINLGVEGWETPGVAECLRLPVVGTIDEPMDFYSPLRVITFSEDGLRALTSHVDGALHLWKISNQPALEESPNQNPDGSISEQLAKWGDAGIAPVHLDGEEVRAQNLAPTISDNEEVEGFRWPDNSYVLLLENGRLVFRNLQDDKETKLIETDVYFRRVRLSNDGRIAAIQLNDSLYVLRVRNGNFVRLSRTVPFDEEDPDAMISFSKNHAFLFFRTSMETLVFDLETSQYICSYQSTGLDRFWAQEESRDENIAQNLPSFCEAVAGKKIASEGGIDGVPPERFLEMESGAAKLGSLVDRLVSWLAAAPNSRRKDF